MVIKFLKNDEKDGVLENDDLFQALSNKVLRYHTICTNILKCEFRAKGLVPTGFTLFEELGVLQSSTGNKRSYRVRNFSVPD